MIQGLRRGGNMGKKPRVDRTSEEKWQIVQEGMKSGNISETCRGYGSLKRSTTVGKMKRNRERRQRLGGRSAAVAESEKDRRIRQLERTLGRKSLEIEILKSVVGE
jgi:hypothetical protein